MKFVFEVIDEVAKAEIEAPNIEILNCISMLGEPLKEVSMPQEDFIKALVLGLAYEDDASEKDNEYKAIELLKRALDEMNKAVAKRGKQNLTDLEKDALKKIPVKYKWIACDKCGAVYVYANEPKRDDELGSWHDCAKDGAFMYVVNTSVFPSLFQWCKWDGEPWYIPDLLK